MLQCLDFEDDGESFYCIFLVLHFLSHETVSTVRKEIVKQPLTRNHTNTICQIPYPLEGERVKSPRYAQPPPGLNIDKYIICDRKII
jgi:hypothetical protein